MCRVCKQIKFFFQDYQNYLETCLYPPKYEDLQINNASQKDHYSITNEDKTNIKLPTYDEALKL